MNQMIFTNMETGLQAQIVATAGKFSVILKDLDADETLPTITRHDALEGAQAQAMKLVNWGSV
jgi:hypothetical protein